ncbi:hypothetical protein D5018_21120 [Parashewanella curva]|uniref:Uncharacterized protein n=1 Tax=Parashewanella curva TaxID=2338552 RepID=A0A3L8PTG9_9GAMM|nr:hypothetical protein D5018_21120 [Parashewanella curva]
MIINAKQKASYIDISPANFRIVKNLLSSINDNHLSAHVGLHSHSVASDDILFYLNSFIITNKHTTYKLK